MNSLTLGFSRTIGSYTEQMEDLSFQKGDFYNIYAHVCSPAEIDELFKKFMAFQIKTISDTSIEIEHIYPHPDASTKIGVGETKTIDFKQYGTYSLTLKKLW